MRTTRRAGFPAAILVLATWTACGGGAGRGVDDIVAPSDVPGRDAPGCSAGTADVRVAVVDAWGRRLPAWTVRLSTPGGGFDPVQASDDDVEVRLSGEAEVRVEASAADHVAATARWRVRPDRPEASERLELSGGVGTDLSVLPGTCPRLTLYVGLDHAWYAASGRPPRSGNRVDLMMDGESTWNAAFDDLAGATTDVRGSTWWWQSDFELRRPAGHETMTTEARAANTVLAILDRVPATKRILVNRFLPDTATGMAYLNTDPDLRQRGRTDGDAFEVMLQGNGTEVPFQGAYDVPAPAWSFPERVRANAAFAGETFAEGPARSAALDAIDAASYHQKTFVIDGRVAWVAGMNVKSTDWDTSEHRVFESRRMKFASSNDERARVQQKRLLPDLGPRKDYAVRVEGPAARDVDDVLRVRWDQGLAEGAMFADHATPFAVPEPPDVSAGSVTLQVVATLPPPIAERSILETWEKALRRAERLVYIEDQYFRMPILNAAIADALAATPGLRLVVITKPLTVSDGGKKWTVEADRRFRALAPDRYLLLQLKSFDAVGRVEPLAGDETAAWYFVDMDVHSKMLVVDDAYLSVGSCNKNNRGLLYEGELDVAVADPAWVKAARQRIVRNLVGPDLAARVGDDPGADFDLLKEAATGNAAVEAWWVANGPFLAPGDVEAAADAHRPDGFAYPLELTSDYALDVGPDAF